MTIKGITRTGGLIATVTLMLAAAPMAMAQTAPVVPTGQVSGGALGALDLWSAPGSDTGLPADLWQGASVELARLVLAQVGTKPLSPAMQRLAIRALETGAQAPDGAGSDADLAALRARALIRFGRAEQVRDMLARTPGVDQSEALTRARSEAALSLGRTDDACEAADALRTGREAVWQLKLRAWCHLASGNAAAASIAYDLWARRGETDAAFSTGFQGAIDGETVDAAALFGVPKPQPLPTTQGVLIDPSRIPAMIGQAVAEQNRTERLKLQSVAMLAASLRDDINPDARAGLATFDVAAPRATFARLGALDAAGDGDRGGEVVLYALSIAHQQPQGLGVAERAAIVRALSRAGLTLDARLLAEEGVFEIAPPPPPPPPAPPASTTPAAADTAVFQ